MTLWERGVRPAHLGQPDSNQTPDAYIGALEEWRARNGLSHPAGSPRSLRDGAPVRLSVFATDAEKVKRSFAFFDTNRDGFVDRDEFAKGLRTINIELSAETTQELFDAAAGSDSVDMADWEAFCKKYPCLRDAMWRRYVVLRDADAERRAAEAAEGRLARQRAQAEAKRRSAEREVAAAEARLRRDEEQLALSAAEQLSRAAAVEAAQRRVAEAVQRRDAAQGTLFRLGPAAERQESARREVSEGLRRARERAEAAVLREERCRAALLQAEQERREADHALAEAQRLSESALRGASGPTPGEALAAAEEELQGARAEERGAAASHRDTQRAGLSAQKDQAKSAALLEKVQARLAEHAAAADTARQDEEENRERKQRALEAGRLGPEREANGEMSWAGQTVNTVVGAEIRLREQRSELKKREQALRSARVAAFSSPPPRLSSPGFSPGRSSQRGRSMPGSPSDLGGLNTPSPPAPSPVNSAPRCR